MTSVSTFLRALAPLSLSLLVFGGLAGCDSSSAPARVDYAGAFGDGGTTRYQCTGTAVDCGARTLANCLAEGYASTCRLAGSCTGTVTACASITDAASCTGQAGCAWDSRFSLCSGTARTCGTLVGYTACTSSFGCTWAGGSCTGHVPACSTLDTACSTFPGCAWTQAP